MKMLTRRMAAGLAVLALASPVHADGYDISVNRLYDLDSASLIYCSSLGKAGQHGNAGTSRGADYTAPLKIKTAGSSTTTVSNVASSGAFKNVNVGDIIAVTTDGIRLERVVVTNADDDTVTVDTAWDLTGGFNYSWRDVSCGTGATSGSIPVADFEDFRLTAQVAQMNATSIDLQVECKHPEGVFLVVATKNVTAGGTGTANYLTYPAVGIAGADEAFFACRVGYKVNTDDGDDTGANAEQINVFLSGRDKRR